MLNKNINVPVVSCWQCGSIRLLHIGGHEPESHGKVRPMPHFLRDKCMLRMLSVHFEFRMAEPLITVVPVDACRVREKIATVARPADANQKRSHCGRSKTHPSRCERSAGLA